MDLRYTNTQVVLQYPSFKVLVNLPKAVFLFRNMPMCSLIPLNYAVSIIIVDDSRQQHPPKRPYSFTELQRVTANDKGGL
jgi:hypothetical protein